MLAAAVCAALVGAGCGGSPDRHAGYTEDEIRLWAEGEAHGGSTAERPLVVGMVEARTAPSGQEYWEVELVEPDGTPHTCLHVDRTTSFTADCGDAASPDEQPAGEPPASPTTVPS